jgi:predicted Fe-Mo cluster-binding NifX family protein
MIANMSKEHFMKICITAQNKDLESDVDPRFGRCKYFIIADTDSGDFKPVINPNIDSSGGAGIQSGQLMADNQVKYVLTGNMGPNAFQTLKAAEVEVITGVTGTVKEAIEKFKNSQFKTTDKPSVDSHFGSR